MAEFDAVSRFNTDAEFIARLREEAVDGRTPGS